MKFKEFVFKNTIRNKNLYMAYFFSTLTTVMTFFTFSVFAFHPKLGGDLHAAVKSGMLASSIIIYLFSFFYVLYSMDIFLQSRKKEFGLLLIQGMSPKQLRKMVFQENTIIGFLATSSGIFIGIFFSQFILWLSKLTMRVDLGFYFPTKAIGVTFVSFLLLFMLISFFIQFKIPKMDVQELLNSNDLGKGEVKPSGIKSILAIVLIGVGYAVALTVKEMGVVMALIPVIFVVILGTKFLFNQLSVFVVNFLRKNENRFWKKTNMLVFSDLAFRMKDNARSFFLVAVITTVAFSAIGTLIGFKEITLTSVHSEPYDFSLQVSEEDSSQGEKELKAINKAFEKNNVSAKEIKVLPVDTSSKDEANNGVKLIDEKQYNEISKELGQDSINLELNQVVLLNDLSLPTMSNAVGNTSLTEFKDVNGKVYQVKKQDVPTKPWANYGEVYVVSEAIYQGYSQKNKPIPIYGWLVTEGSFDQQKAVGNSLNEFQTIMSKASMTQDITDFYAPILFIGFFIGIVFFVSAGSFLYFRLYSDMDVDVEKFKMVYKLGFSKKEMKKVVYQQVGILFFTPIIVSSIHGVVALKAMYALFNQGLQITALYVLATFILIQIIYYLIARVFYFRKLYRAVTA